MKNRFIGLSGIALLVLAGCSEGPQGVPVRGQVVDGASPVSTGMLIMTPAQGTDGPKVTVPLDSTGSFSISAEEGPAAGDYVVSLQAQDPLADSRSTGLGAPAGTGEMELSGSAPKSWPVTFQDGENSITLDLNTAQ